MTRHLKPGEPTDDTPHTVGSFNPLGEPATEIAAGVLLQTRDGSRVGNAIIIKQIVHDLGYIEDYLRETGQKLWLIETDFGNQTRLVDREILSQFKLGQQSDYDRWFDDRLELIKHNIP